MILLCKGKYVQDIQAIDLSRADWFEVAKKLIRVIFPGSDWAHIVEFDTELSDEEQEQLAYNLASIKNENGIVRIEDMIKAVKKEGQK